MRVFTYGAPGQRLPLFQLALLVAATFFGHFSVRTVSSLQESMRIALGLTDNHMALLQGPALAFPIVLAAIPLGILVDRTSRARILLVITAGSVIGTLLTAFATNFTMLLAARALVGLSAGTVNVAAYSMLADLFIPTQRGRAKSALVAGHYTGASAAFAAGGLLLVMMGPGQDSWRWAMACMACPLVLVAITMLALREPARTGSIIERPSLRETIHELWGYRAIVFPLTAAVMMLEIPLASVVVWGAPMLTRTFLLPPDRVGAIMATIMLMSGIGGPILGGLVGDACQRSGGTRRTLKALAALAFISAAGSSFVLAKDSGLTTLVLLLLMTAVSAAFSMSVTLFTIVVPNELRGLCLALLTALAAIVGIALAPLIVSLLSGAIGGPNMIGYALALVCLPASLLAGASFIVGLRKLPRTADLLPRSMSSERRM